MWAKTKSTATKLARARSSRAVAKVVMTAWRVEGTPLRVRPVSFGPAVVDHLERPNESMLMCVTVSDRC